jgi:hypothetical protein
MSEEEHVTRLGETRNTNKILLGKPKGKSPLERPRLRWDDNIKADITNMVLAVDCIFLAQHRDQ